ncbi:mannuronate-specific alginate lyase [Pseudomonas sp. LS44]|uniref:mannuronate-specific alginate lyase n=1 Tax=Pseudomonas sp. LS44 TaxID=1357074 RepID=UPI00215B63FC|nr:mannuronate-specific alginate lyase [Pseudomonas sp. LS44]UVE16867.1 mannuronate-specific alginate lyase [Pseudomonas sp. LS44]
MRAQRLLLSLLTCTLFATGTVQAAGLVPPPGYYAAIEQDKKAEPQACALATPTPYTDALVFRSKYEGSGQARATLNREAEKDFREKTKAINELERGVNKQVMRYMQDSHPQSLQCTLQWLTAWAQANALLSTDYNHTGKSMRKWALGSLSSAWLRLKFSESQPLTPYAPQSQQIEAWFAEVAEQTVKDWSDLPLQQINNHSYWAAWSVMATAVVTDRRDLFDWSVQQFQVAAGQVDSDGFLPNELKRQKRALDYHNYALPPLAMIAAFAQANGVDLRDDHDQALRRVAERVMQGIADPQAFVTKVGKSQKIPDLDEAGKFAWLEPYCTLYRCSAETLKWKQSMQPLKNFRLGGDLTQLFEPKAEEKEKKG